MLDGDPAFTFGGGSPRGFLPRLGGGGGEMLLPVVLFAGLLFAGLLGSGGYEFALLDSDGTFMDPPAPFIGDAEVAPRAPEEEDVFFSLGNSSVP